MNWKWIVGALLGGVILFHLGVVWILSQRSFELTSDDYYQRDLAYQTTIDAKKAAARFSWNLDCGTKSRCQLSVVDGEEKPLILSAATLELYRPNQSNLDGKYTLNTLEQGVYVADVPNMAAGRWDASIHARLNGEVLIHETRLVLP